MDFLQSPSKLALVAGSVVVAAAGFLAVKYLKFGGSRKPATIFDCAKEGNIEAVFARASKLTSGQLGTSIDGLLDDEGYTLAMRAIEGNQYDMVVALVTRMNASIGLDTKNQYGFTCLHLAAYHEVSPQLFDYVLDASTKVVDSREAGGWSPLIIAASKGNLEFCEKLIKRGANVNAVTHMDQTALYVASNNGYLGIVKLLIESGADAKIRVKKSFDSPAIAAITSGRIEVLQYLVKSEPELLRLPTVSGATLLHAAAQIGKLPTVEDLLKAGAEVDAKKKDGTTPLACAAALGHTLIVAKLIENGASLEVRNGFGGTPLHLACNSKQLAMVKLLLESKANPNAADTDRISPLQSLCSSAQTLTPLHPNNIIEIQIFDLLLLHGADLNHKDRSNATFLHQLVCKPDNATLLRHVLAKCPQFDLFQEDKFGYMALHIAYRYRHTEMIEILESAMKSANPVLFASFNPDKERIEPPVGICDIFESIPESERKSVLNMDFTLEAFARRILDGSIRNVIVLTGAGISTNSGIPDFRSPEKGLYTSPQFRARFGPSGVSGLFAPDAVAKRPEEFFSVCKEVFGPAVDGRYKPTPAHFFLKLLHDKGILRRNYTQNIDMLERLVGLPREKVIEAHGSFAKATCIKCFAPCTNMREYWNDIQSDVVPRCESCRSVLRPNVVFFGEGLPAEFTDHQAADFGCCDLLIVMGTSLKVYPFAGLTNQVTNLTPRLLFNLEPVGAFEHGVQWQLAEAQSQNNASGATSSNVATATTPQNQGTLSLQRTQGKKEYSNTYRDVSVLGDIDQGVLMLVKALGWDSELNEMIRSYKPANHFE
jgi:NAD-dependent deacetylase sirtuin 2